MSNFDHQIAYLDVDDIKVGVTIQNIRTVFDEERIQELADSIYNEGLMNPLIVAQVEVEEDEFVNELIAGERRLRAIKWIQEHLDSDFLAGPDEEELVPCIEYTGDIKGAAFSNAIENIERAEVDDVDIAAWIYARAKDGIKQTDIAARLHKKLQWVNFRHTFHERSCPELKDLLRDGLISFTAAYELSKNVDEAEQKKRVKKARKFNEKISIEEAKNAGNPNKTARPSKKQRDIIRARLEDLADVGGRPDFRGAATALRWTEGLISDDEMEEFLEMPLEDAG
jgi:ParB family chromosome partitioning protein